jgi:hypothetical protein
LRDLDAGEGRALGRRAASEGGTLRVRGFQQPSACLGDVPLAAKEIYASDERHRFDILVTILNQLPGSLRAIAQRAQSWRSGAGGTNGDTAVCRMEVAVDLSRFCAAPLNTYCAAKEMSHEHRQDG